MHASVCASSVHVCVSVHASVCADCVHVRVSSVLASVCTGANIYIFLVSFSLFTQVLFKRKYILSSFL